MAPISPGRPSGPPRKARKQTQTTKSHRYEPFNKRVAKLKIDPIHKVQQSRLKETNDDISQSHFRTALEEWSELNLTTTFTSFLNQVNPLSESLPQILHHTEQIVAALLAHIEKQDPLALEALLSLVAHLARDLGQGFEKYFAKTVTLVARVSTTQDDPAVVEACFTCLAWIYKYLSKLLVQDLTQLLDILLPYFSARKEHIRRFTAESLAFLLHKAAISYPKDRKPLRTAIRHIFQPQQAGQSLREERIDTYAGSVMTLLAECAAGVDAGLHSSAVQLYDCVYEQATLPETSDFVQRILGGLTVYLIHQTDASGFRPVLDFVVHAAQNSSPIDIEASMASRLLFIVTSTRGGSRINDWTPVVQSLVQRLENHASSTNRPSADDLVKAVTASIHHAPLDQLLPSIPRLIKSISKQTPPATFFSFCEAIAKLDQTRFQDLILPHLQQYISSRWAEDETGLVVLLNDLHEIGCVRGRHGQRGYLAVSDEWEASLRSRWSSTKSSPTEQDILSLLLAQFVHFPKSIEAASEYRGYLYQKLDAFISGEPVDLTLDTRMALGSGLHVLLSLADDQTRPSQELYSKLMSVNRDAFQLLPFIRGLSAIAARSSEDSISTSLRESVTRNLLGNMLNRSVQLRKASFDLLLGMSEGNASMWLTEVVELCQDILDTDYTIANARKLAMLVRKLPQVHKRAPSDRKWTTLIPYFTLGLLPDYHDHLRKDVASALSQIMTDSATEEVIVEVLRDWLHAMGHTSVGITSSAEEHSGPVSAFDCTRMRAVEDVFNESASNFANAAKLLGDRVQEMHNLQTMRTPNESRLIALQVLIEIPQTAEKRSKILVPAFLAAQRRRSGHVTSFADETSINTLSPDIEESGWSPKERRLFLQLLAIFNNPRVLYRADDVHNILLELLSDGDAETRKLSLQALLKWKNRALLAHQERLLQVAEEKQTTSELGLLLSTNDESSLLKGNERQDVLPVLLRLVFGQLISRVGVHGSQEAKRKALLRLLIRMESQEVLSFLDIVLGRLKDISALDLIEPDEQLLSTEVLSDVQQYGFLRMMLSMLELLQSQFDPFGFKVVPAVLYCTARACLRIDNSQDLESVPALQRNLRRTGIQCLNLIFEHCQSMDVTPFAPAIRTFLLRPRLPNFVTENSQGVSGLLKMISMWARSPITLRLLENDGDLVLRVCWGLLSSESAKSPVKSFVLDSIATSLLAATKQRSGEENRNLISEETPYILAGIADLLQQSPPKDLLSCAASVVQQTISLVADANLKDKIIDLLTTMLDEPNQRLPPHVKGQLLLAIERATENHSLVKQYSSSFFETLSSFLDFFRDVPSRQTCVRLLGHMARDNHDVVSPFTACQKLNASSVTRLDEVDDVQQSEAFTLIHELLSSADCSRVFLPVLHNLIFLVRSNDDSATRGNALGCLKHFVSVCRVGEESNTLKSTLLNAIKKHVKDDSETSRADFIELLGTTVKHWADDEQLKDMQPLLVGNDDEASFFTNVMHIQQHRRTRAIRRLVAEVETGGISATNIAQYFLPLLQKFAVDAGAGDSAQATKGQSIASMTTLLQWLDWKTFRRVFRQYKQIMEHKTEDDKLDLRLLDHAADALAIAMAQKSSTELGKVPLTHLAKSLPEQATIRQELKTNFIPKLAELSHYKDEVELSQRLPAAVVAVKLIKLLPENETSILAAPVALDIAQVLRSRTQETRDVARNKLAEVVKLLGAGSVQFILRELRTALTQGYQLHVLSYTLHTILLATAEQRKIGDLDYCLDDLVKVLLDDVFGVVGQQKENQDYISSMKEVKSNKSFDSMEILARCTSVQHLSKLVLPFEPLLAGSLTSKQIRHVDELFRRIGVGISHSPAASSQDLLVFAFELIKSFYRAKPAAPVRPKTNDEKNRERFLIQKDNTGKIGKVSSASQLYKLAKFAIDIARSTFARHAQLTTPENVHGFLPVVGDALVEAQEDVKISAMRLLSAVIKLRMPQLQESAKLYVMEAVKVVKSAISTNEEAAQAALKVVAAVLRDGQSDDVRESDIAYLLKRTMPDLEEPDRQGVTFNFVKAVMARQMQMPEVYELVDKLGLMMVTSQSRNSRDAARGVYVHFILDYPQGKARWSKQIKFLVKNLEYQYPEGRQSIMEATSVLLSKIDKGTAKEMAAVLFIPIVLRMANDENERCREMAAALLALLFQRTSSEEAMAMLEPLRAWLEQDNNTMLRKISLQAWNIYFESAESRPQEEVAFVKDQLSAILRDSRGDEHAWELIYHALELISTLVKHSTSSMLTQQQKQLWDSVVDASSFPHPWVQHSASTLVGMFFRDCIDAGSTSIPLRCSHGLTMGEQELIDLLRAGIASLKRSSTSTELADIVTQNVLYIARCTEAHGSRISIKHDADLDEQSGDDNDHQDSDVEQGLNGHAFTNANSTATSIPVAQYILDQSTRALRREPGKQTSAALQPKLSFLNLITPLIQHLSRTSLSNFQPSIISLFIPLLHLTSPMTPTPRSSDPTFNDIYTTLIERSQLMLEALQSALSDQMYMRCVTAATKQAREKRAERRNKRAIETIAEPERAAREKRRRFEKKKERRKEVKGIHRGKRRSDLGF